MNYIQRAENRFKIAPEWYQTSWYKFFLVNIQVYWQDGSTILAPADMSCTEWWRVHTDRLFENLRARVPYERVKFFEFMVWYTARLERPRPDSSSSSSTSSDSSDTEEASAASAATQTPRVDPTELADFVFMYVYYWW